MLFFLQILFILMLKETLGKYEKYICGMDDTVNMEADKIYFIETPNYPSILDNPCSITFQRNITNGETNKKFFFAQTNLCFFLDCDFIVSTNATNTFTTEEDPYTSYAFQGFAIFDDWGDNSCPLESISRVDPFNFDDVTQILWIQSSYPKLNRSHPCLWQFTAPNGYGFKIVIIKLNLMNNTTLEIEKKDHSIWTNSHLIKNVPYYSNDNYLKISLSGNYLPENNSMEFQAYISIVKINIPISDTTCQITKNSKTHKWGNYNKTNGYPNNAHCGYDLLVKAGTEILVKAFLYALEYNVDMLYMYFDGNGSEPIITDEMLTNCTCGNPNIVVDCYYTGNYNIMGNSDNYYCGGLSCNFSIKSNPSCNKPNVIQMKITSHREYPDEISPVFDIFRVLSNNDILLEITYKDWETRDYFLYLGSDDNNIFEIITVPSFFYRKMSWNLTLIAPYKNGCVWGNNVFTVTRYQAVRNVSAMSDKDKMCRIFVVLGDIPGYYYDSKQRTMLSKIWISRTSKGELNILAGERASKVASIELESLSSYTDIILSAMIYIFEIPPATAVFMTFNDAFSDPIVITYPFKTIVTSPLYGSNSDIITSVPYLVYDIHKSSARFSLLQYDIPSEMEYYIIVDGVRINITSNFGSMIFSNTTVELNRNCVTNFLNHMWTCGVTNFNSTYDVAFEIEAIKTNEFTTTSFQTHAATLQTTVEATSPTTTSSFSLKTTDNKFFILLFIIVHVF